MSAAPASMAAAEYERLDRQDQRLDAQQQRMHEPHRIDGMKR